jgi:hypothetical protein
MHKRIEYINRTRRGKLGSTLKVTLTADRGLVRKDDGDFPTLVSNFASDLCRRPALRDRIDSNVKHITAPVATRIFSTTPLSR